MMKLNLKMSLNASCPCNSGKKYKMCCMGKLTSMQENYFGFLNKQKIIKDKISKWIASYLSEDDLQIYIDEFNCGKNPDEFNDIAFFDWLFFEARIGNIMFTQFVFDHSPEMFDDIEKQIINEYINNTSTGIFEITNVEPEAWKFHIRDIFTKKEYEITDRMGSLHFVKGDILISRIQKIFSNYYMTGTGTVIPRRNLEQLKEFTNKKLLEKQEKNPKITYEKFMSLYSNEISHFIPKEPKFKNSLGDEVSINEINYSFDIKRIDEILDYFYDKKDYEIIDIDYSKKGFRSAQIAIIAKKGSKNESSGDIRLTNHYFNEEGQSIETNGSINIKKNKVCVFANSDDVAKKAKKDIESLGFLKFIDESSISPDDIKESKSSRKDKKENSEETFALSKKFFTDYYKKWCYQNIPALGNISPKNAVKTKEGREKLKELLIDFENSDEHLKKEGKQVVSSVDIIRKELDFYDE